ncbi:MAG: extracellular solute-binding protein [Nitrospirae bacterium]|nr:extracellular solute-binding protein [Nitrospirota bacterium]
MAGECLPDRTYSEAEFAEFAARYPHAGIDIGGDEERARLVLMENREILQDIEEFRRGFSSERGLGPGDLTIRVLFIGWHNYPLQRIIDDAVSEGADVVQIGSTWTAALAERGVLKEISSVVKPVEGEFIPSALQGSRIQGEDGYYAIPWVLDIRTWFYNRELFEEAGISADSIKGLDDLEVACEKFRKNTSGRDVWFVGIPTSGDDYSTLHNAMTWIWGWGGDIVNGAGVPVIADRRAIEGMSRYVGLAVKGCAPLKGTDGKAVRLVDVETGFLEGRYAMIFIGPWVLDAVARADSPGRFVNAGSLSGPAVSAGNIFTGGSQLALINSPRTPLEEEAAREFLGFLSARGNPGAGLSPRERNFVGLLSDPELSTYPLTLIRQEFRAYPSIPEWGEVERIMVRRIANIFTRAGEGEDPAGAAAEEFETALGEIERTLGQDSMSDWKIAVLVVLAGGALLYPVWRLLGRRSSSPDLVDAVRKFHRIKDVLHRAKVSSGIITDDEDVEQKRSRISGHLETVLEESGRLRGRDGPGPCKMTEVLEAGHAVIIEYMQKVKKEYPSPEQYETALIEYFENRIRPLIDDMSKVLKEDYYIEAERLWSIIRDLEGSKDFEHNVPAGMKTSDTIVISPNDLRSCLGNLIHNARDAVSGVDDPQIVIEITPSDEYICISVKDNGIGFRQGCRGRGHGLDDVEKALGRWGGELGIAAGDGARGTVMTLKLRRF